ncbi:galactokinase family protein [Aerococcus viridans]|uniref:galactokinase family protein n=1 Tax=Aerococcus viridans TaxID=1377 RepID=UPI0039AEA4F8
MSNLMDTFIAKYGPSDNIRVVKSPLRIHPIGTRSEYQGGVVNSCLMDINVDGLKG